MAARKEERVDNSSPVTTGDVVLKKYRVTRVLDVGALDSMQALWPR
jgi:hypothetical protein